MQPAAAAHTFLPAGHAEGWVETFRELYRSVYAAVAAGGAAERARLPDVRGGAPRERAGRRDRPVECRATMGGGAWMKLGLLTAAFPRLSLERVATWAATNGF